MQDIKSLYNTAKNTRDKNAINAYREAVMYAFDHDPISYALQLEYIISSSETIGTVIPFIEKHGLPISLFEKTKECVSNCKEKLEKDKVKCDEYDKTEKYLEEYYNKYSKCFVMDGFITESTDDRYVTTYYSNFNGNPGRVLLKGMFENFGNQSVMDSIITASKFGESTLNATAQYLFQSSNDKMFNEALYTALSGMNINENLMNTIYENTNSFIVNQVIQRNKNILRESVIMNNQDAMYEYTQDEIDAITDLLSFKEYCVLCTDELGTTIEECNKTIYELANELDGLETEDCADLISMLPQSRKPVQYADESIFGPGNSWIGNTSDKKTGKAPNYLAHNHDMINYGEDDIDKKHEKNDDNNKKEKSLEDYLPTSSPKTSYTDTSYLDDDDNEDEEDKNDIKKSNSGNNYYYYTYNNSLNKNSNSFNKDNSSHDDHSSHTKKDDHSTHDDHSKHNRSDDHSTNKRVNSDDYYKDNNSDDENIDNDSKPKTESAPWELCLESADTDKKTIDKLRNQMAERAVRSFNNINSDDLSYTDDKFTEKEITSITTDVVLKLSKNGLLSKLLAKLSKKIRDNQRIYRSYNIVVKNINIGYIAFDMISPTTIDIWWVEIYDTWNRKKGYAKDSLKLIIDKCKKYGFKTITFAIFNKPEAKRLCESVGFKQVGTDGEGRDKLLIMELELRGVKPIKESYFNENDNKPQDDSQVGSADDSRPQSDHPIKDIAMDVDRKLAKTGQGIKKGVQNVQNAGRAVAKPVKRAVSAVGKMVTNAKDSNEEKMKEQMADPHARNNLYSMIKKAITAGALWKVGLLQSPIFWFLLIGSKISNSAKSERIRDEMIGELKTEIEIINKKIDDCDREHYGDNAKEANAAKYKLIRLKNEMQKKLLRVSGGKQWHKVI